MCKISKSISCKLNSLLIILLIFSSIQNVNASTLQDTIVGNIDSTVYELMKKGDIPGLSIVIIKGNSFEYLKGYGYADKEKETKVFPNTLFEIGSCSKAFTALGLMKLEEEGLIKLDDPVSKYLSWFYVNFEGKKTEITIRQLLHHTSGIPWEAISDIPQDSTAMALENTIRKIVGIRLNHYPGKKFEYSTINYDIIGLIIEKTSGLPYGVYMRKNVFDPLGMTNTTVRIPQDGQRIAKGYKIGFFSAREYISPVYSGNSPAAYIVSNAEDMAIWLKYQMGLVKPGFDTIFGRIQESDKSVPPSYDFSSYAMGWNISLNGDDKIWHGGLNPNYTAYIAFNKITQKGVVVLANSNSNYTQLIGDYMFAKLHGSEFKVKAYYDNQADKAFSVLSIILGVFLLAGFAFLCYLLSLVFKGKRRYVAPSWKKLGRFVTMLLFMVPVLFGIYFIPKAMMGFSWNAFLVWAPISLNIFLYFIVATFCLIILLYSLTTVFPHPNSYYGSAPGLIGLSLISGISNMVIILLITSSVGKTETWYSLFYFILVYIIYIIARKIVQTRLYKITMSVVYDLRKQLVDKIFSSTYQEFEKIDRGQVYATLNDDTNIMGNSANIFVGLITSIITVIAAFVYLATIAFWSTLLTLGIITVIVLVYNNISFKAQAKFEKARDSQNVYMRMVNGIIDGYKELSLQNKKKQEYKEEVLSASDTFRKQNISANVKFINAFLIGESLLIFVLGFVAFGFVKFFPEIESFKLISFVIVLLYLIGPVNGILMSMPAVMQLKVAWGRIQQFLEKLNTIAIDKTMKISLNNKGKADSLSLHGVRFAYKTPEGQNDFEVGPVDFEVNKGEIVFIIGGNGSGKTTLAKLITGLYKADSGEIRINGVEVNGELGEYFSTVLNPFHLFDKMYNVDLNGKTDIVADYLKVLDLDKKVGLNGNAFTTTDLSGGQRKRLAMLQCYLEDQPIYLFDEWAADQDPEYRRFFYRQLLPEMKEAGKIIIAITHDDHYFDVADKILKLDMGKVEFISNSSTVENVLYRKSVN
jgi:putative pyoverdin transport system ATP-binding/permease protein